MPKQSIDVLNLSVVASGAVAAFRAVGFDGAQAATQGQKVFGVSRTKAEDGRTFAVTVIGTAVIETGAAVDAGGSLITDAEGRAIPETGGDASETVFADALDAADAAGAFIEVLLRR